MPAKAKKATPIAAAAAAPKRAPGLRLCKMDETGASVPVMITTQVISFDDRPSRDELLAKMNDGLIKPRNLLVSEDSAPMPEKEDGQAVSASQEAELYPDLVVDRLRKENESLKSVVAAVASAPAASESKVVVQPITSVVPMLPPPPVVSTSTSVRMNDGVPSSADMVVPAASPAAPATVPTPTPTPVAVDVNPEIVALDPKPAAIPVAKEVKVPSPAKPKPVKFTAADINSVVVICKKIMRSFSAYNAKSEEEKAKTPFTFETYRGMPGNLPQSFLRRLPSTALIGLSGKLRTASELLTKYQSGPKELAIATAASPLVEKMLLGGDETESESESDSSSTSSASDNKPEKSSLKKRKVSSPSKEKDDTNSDSDDEDEKPKKKKHKKDVKDKPSASSSDKSEKKKTELSVAQLKGFCMGIADFTQTKDGTDIAVEFFRHFEVTEVTTVDAIRNSMAKFLKTSKGRALYAMFMAEFEEFEVARAAVKAALPPVAKPVVAATASS